MQIDQTILDEWYDLAEKQNSLLLRAGDALRGGRMEDAADLVDTARRKALLITRQMDRAGAVLPPPSAAVENALDLSLSGLTISDAARRDAEALRAAANARLALEKERGIEDGLGELLSDWATQAERNVFGPVGSGLE